MNVECAEENKERKVEQKERLIACMTARIYVLPERM